MVLNLLWCLCGWLYQPSLLYLNYVLYMDYNVNYLVWKVLCWNIRGLNSDDKQLALREKITESGCAVACIQETKKE